MNKRQFADRLRSLREERGLTQPELAQKCHVGQSQVSRWENGTALPSGPKMKPLADALKIDLSTLYEWLIEASQDELKRVRRDRDNLIDWMEKTSNNLDELIRQVAGAVDRLERLEKRSPAQS